MDFVSRVLDGVKKDLNPHEGACGICHLALKKLSEEGGKAISYEVPEGTTARVLDNHGEIIGEGLDLVWAPAILEAEIDAGLIPQAVSKILKNLLTSAYDRKKVAEIYGYGRCVTPASKAISIIWQEGGRVEIDRNGLGIRASLHEKDGDLISEAVTGFCPICAVNISVSRNQELRERIRSDLEDKTNTGRLKYERGLINMVEWKKRRVFAYIEDQGKIIGKNWGCCIAYSTVRAEISAGFGSQKWNRLFKNYCDFCPLKHCWMDKSMGALGNIILDRMKTVDMDEKLKIDEYLKAIISKDEQVVREGIGTLCSLSATVNAFLRADAVEILQPSPARGFPYDEKKLDKKID